MERGHPLSRTAALGLGVFAVVGGCGDWRPVRTNPLPTQLAMLVEDTDGASLSLVMDLRRNTRNQLDVRVSEGNRLFDGRHLWDLQVHSAAEGYTVALKDLLKGDGALAPPRDRPRDLPFTSTSSPKLLSMDRDSAWFETSTGIVECALQRGGCKPAGAPPPSELEHPGPNAGFLVVLDPSGNLRLTLPLDEVPGGQVILSNISRIIGTHWVHEGFLQRDPVLDRMFRGRGSIVAEPREVTRDGRLVEWIDAEPLVVDSPWQLELGANHWSGPRDASFSVTAARGGSGVCFAGRVRDDALGPQDELVLRVAEQDLRIPLTEAAAGTRVVVGPDWYGVHFEACLPEVSLTDRQPPFWASLHDVDGSDEPTVLSTAPVDDTRVTGTIEL